MKEKLCWIVERKDFAENRVPPAKRHNDLPLRPQIAVYYNLYIQPNLTFTCNLYFSAFGCHSDLNLGHLKTLAFDLIWRPSEAYNPLILFAIRTLTHDY